MTSVSPCLPPCSALRWLPQEASNRRFGRVESPLGIEAPTAILMAFPEGTPEDEIHRVAQATTLLQVAGLPVPQIYETAITDRWILQEDLGDRHLADALEEDLAPLYEEALSHLDTFQSIPPHDLETSPIPCLNFTRLCKELTFFAEHAVPESDPTLTDDLENLAQRCADLDTVTCHRDYHARNLMIIDSHIRIIDHQDAMAGPAPYDRVSLAYDPYVTMDDTFRDELAGTEPGTGPVAVQRLCKALGTYASKGEAWTAFIAPAARQARRLLALHNLELPALDAALAPLDLDLS